MGIFESLFSGRKPLAQSRQERINQPRFSSFEESVVYEQIQSGRRWHGVLIKDLNELAQDVAHVKCVLVDEDGFLRIYCLSRSGKTGRRPRCVLDKNGQLVKESPGQYYSNQWRDEADIFIDRANQQFSFD